MYKIWTTKLLYQVKLPKQASEAREVKGKKQAKTYANSIKMRKKRKQKWKEQLL